MSIYSDFAMPLVDPFDKSATLLPSVVTSYEDAQKTLQQNIQSLVGVEGTGSLSGFTGASVAHATQQLVDLISQRLDVINQVIDACKSCSQSAASAVSTIEKSLPADKDPDKSTVEKIFQQLTLAEVISYGRGAIDAAVNIVKQEYHNSTSRFHPDLEVKLLEFGEELFEAGQELTRELKLIESMESTMTSMPNSSVSTVFSQVPALSSITTSQGGLVLTVSTPSTTTSASPGSDISKAIALGGVSRAYVSASKGTKLSTSIAQKVLSDTNASTTAQTALSEKTAGNTQPVAPMGVSESSFMPMAMGMQSSMMIGMGIMNAMSRSQSGGGNHKVSKAGIIS
jgi:hypothetical protein